jgi:hypothetical protein
VSAALTAAHGFDDPLATTLPIGVASAARCSECGGPVADPQASAINRWAAALTRHDDVEVERLVQQSRADRVDGVADRLLGSLPGIGPSTAPPVEAT